MGIKTREDYLAAMRAMRPNVYKFGELIEDITTHPATKRTVESHARNFDAANDPELEDLYTTTSSFTGEKVLRWNSMMQSSDDLIDNMKIKRQNYRRTGTCTGGVCVGWNAQNVLWAVTEEMDAEFGTDYQARLKGITDSHARAARIREVLESVHMWDQRQKKIGAYSGGMKQRIGIAQVLLHLPRILVVDEPTAGLDPRERIRFRNLLVELSASRVVIFSTHIIEDISSSCNTMAVINRGEVLFNGTPGEMTEIARGKVWKISLPSGQFEEATREMLVVHHMRDGKEIRFRCISGEKPFPGAVEESPLLEDAYLWLLRKDKENKERQRHG